MAATFRCAIVTPDRTRFDEEAVYASFPAWDGQQGVMTGQSPLLSRLAHGPLRVDTAGGASHWFLVEGGFAQVAEGSLTILTPRASPAAELSAEEAERELAEANARIGAAGKDLPAVERDQQRAFAKLALARARGDRGAAAR
jgi:F-type H+-transporting ATPase subunit epsilon